MKLPENMTLGVKGLVTTGMLALLVGCGGGGSSSGDGSSPTLESVVSRGVITQLGSIWVNGCRYEETAGGTYKSDDNDSASFDDYQIGMNVGIRGSKQVGSDTCEADEVEYEAEIEGAADASGKIFGITILQTPDTNAPGIPDPLEDGIRYEVSGIWINDTTMEATYIKLDDDGDGIDEIKGFVEAVVPGVSLTVHGTTYTYGGPTVVAVKDYVEIHFNGTVASSVEIEDDFIDDDDGQEAEYEGAVNMDSADLAGCPAGADFLIDVICIDWDSVPASGWMDGLIDSSDMVPGLRVEAEGHFNAAGLLVAEKIKGRGNRVRVTSIADNVNPVAETFDLFFGAIQVTTMLGVTEYDMDGGTTFGAISDPDEVEVRGVRTGPNSMLALRIKSETVDPDKHELRAEVDLNGVDSVVGTVTVMGITSKGDSSTQLEVNDIIYTQGLTSFLDMIDDDDIVNSTNGPRDVIEVEVDTTVDKSDGSTLNPYGAGEIEIEEEDD